MSPEASTWVDGTLRGSRRISMYTVMVKIHSSIMHYES